MTSLLASFSPTHPFGTATSRRERMVIAMVVGSLGTLGFSITAPLLPDLADAFGVSRGAIGLVQAAVSIPGVLASAMIGYLADRVGRRRVVLVSLLIFSTFGIAGFFARSFWGLVIVRFLQGIGTSGILGLSIVLVGDLFEGVQRTRAMGYNLTFVTMVSMFGPAVSGFLAVDGIFRPFLIFAIGYPLALWATRMPTDKPSEPVEPPIRHGGDAVRTMRSAGTFADFIGVLIATLGAVIVLHGLGFTTTPLFLSEAFGSSVALRGVIVATFQVGVIVAALRIGWVRGRFGASWSMTLGFVLMSLGTGLAMVAPAPWFVALGLAVSGVGFGMFTPLAQDYSARAAGALYRGITVLTWVTVVRVAQVVGPPTGSFLSEAVSARLTFGLAAVGMAVLAGSWRPIRKYVHRRDVGGR